MHNVFLKSILILCLTTLHPVFSQQRKTDDKNLLLHLMQKYPAKFAAILKDPAHFKVQIIYSQIDRSKNGNKRFNSFYFRHNSSEYFDPASMVKLPLSILALEKLDLINVPGLDRNTRLEIESSNPCQASLISDPSAIDSVATIGHFIRKALIVSDNDSYNRLFQFLGQKYIQDRLIDLGFQNCRIVQLFSKCDSTDCKYSPTFRFYNKGEVIYTQNQTINTSSYSPPLRNMVIGKKSINKYNKVVNHGKDFSKKNFFPLDEMHLLLTHLVFPDPFQNGKKMQIKEEERNFILANMSCTPDESGIAVFKDSADFFPTLTNYLFYGSDRNKKPDKNLKIYNIVGQSYGFLSDCAYFSDTSNKVEFFLSAVIYVNNNQIVNTGTYEYISVGFPFMMNLGQLIYKYELTRKK